VDPVKLLSRLERFAQPLEVREPLEILRAGMVFHARGLLNTGAIQHNRDWIWPFWVERQFDPENDAFIPRAFSLTHVNLTNRNSCQSHEPQLDRRGDPRLRRTAHRGSEGASHPVLGQLVSRRLDGVRERTQPRSITRNSRSTLPKDSPSSPGSPSRSGFYLPVSRLSKATGRPAAG